MEAYFKSSPSTKGKLYVRNDVSFPLPDAKNFGCVAGKSYGRGWEQAGWLTVFTKFATWKGKPANGYTLVGGRRAKSSRNNVWGDSVLRGGVVRFFETSFQQEEKQYWSVEKSGNSTVLEH